MLLLLHGPPRAAPPPPSSSSASRSAASPGATTPPGPAGEVAAAPGGAAAGRLMRGAGPARAGFPLADELLLLLLLAGIGRPMDEPFRPNSMEKWQQKSVCWEWGEGQSGGEGQGQAPSKLLGLTML